MKIFIILLPALLIINQLFSQARIIVDFNQTASQIFNKNWIDIETKLKVEYSFEKLDELSYRLTYRKIFWQQEGGGTTINYDSSKKNNTKKINPFSFLLNESITLKFNSVGKIINAIGEKNVVENVIAKIKTKAPKSQQPSLIKIFNRMHSREHNLKTFTPFFLGLPPSSLPIGESWKEKYVTGTAISINVIQSTTLKEKLADRVILEGSATLKTNSKSPAIQNPKYTISYNLTGKQESLSILSRTTGFPYSVTLKQSLSGSANLKSSQIKKKWPLAVYTIIKMSLIEEKN